MPLIDDFNASAVKAKTLSPNTVTNEDLLTLYGLYKQATQGDNTTTRPGFMDFTGKAKWDAWTKNNGLSTDTAMLQYIRHVQIIMKREITE
jgi:diazepam-binding inhibitor (GABA receptor modulating acyl-CoA-binding protein)